jgi:glucokinase
MSTGCSECHAIYDAGAAALGELWQGEIEEQGRFLLLTLGTGLGAAFVEDGLVVTGEQVCGIPDSGELWDFPYMDTVLEDFTGTTKAAVAIYRGLGGSDGDVLAGDLESLANMQAEDGQDSIATETFAEFGRRLGEGLAPIVRAFRPRAIVLSGNISKAYDLFEPEASEALERGLVGSGVSTSLRLSALVDTGGLLGAAFRAFYPDRPFRRD